MKQTEPGVDEQNPYAATKETALRSGQRTDPWLLIGLLVVLSAYYAVSSCTLPFADDVWFGEMPVLALPQLPKSFAFSFVRGTLMSMMRTFGLSSGSFSPDAIASKPWAFAIVFLAPSVLLLAVVSIFRQAKRLQQWIVLLLIMASIDAAVTVWFEWSSRLSLF